MRLKEDETKNPSSEKANLLGFVSDGLVEFTGPGCGVQVPGMLGFVENTGSLMNKVFKASLGAKTPYKVINYFYNVQNSTHAVIAHCL